MEGNHPTLEGLPSKVAFELNGYLSNIVLLTLLAPTLSESVVITTDCDGLGAGRVINNNETRGNSVQTPPWRATTPPWRSPSKVGWLPAKVGVELNYY